MPEPFDYIVTYSGREVSPTRGVPSVEDLALSLSRQPRFGGMCRRHWTVVDHSLFVSILAERDGQPAEVQLACLLHDAHEWTGDIPTHFKTMEQRAMQVILDQKIQEAYAADTEHKDWKLVKDYDSRALLAEALVVGPPQFKETTEVEKHFGARPHIKDVVALMVRLERGELGVDPSELSFLYRARNARAFVTRLEMLQEKVAHNHRAEPKGFVANERKGEQ